MKLVTRGAWRLHSFPLLRQLYDLRKAPTKPYYTFSKVLENNLVCLIGMISVSNMFFIFRSPSSDSSPVFSYVKSIKRFYPSSLAAYRSRDKSQLCQAVCFLAVSVASSCGLQIYVQFSNKRNMSISDRKNKNLSFFHATCSSELQNVPCICYTLENEYTFF